MGFFDNLNNSLQETSNKIQKESKCKKTIADNKNKVEKTYSEMGKKIYESRTINEEIKKYIEEQIAEIDKMLKENEELNKEILKLNNKKLCPNCNAEVEINTTFCPQCGKEQEKIEVEPFIPNGKRKCSGCGEIIDDKNVFCPNCGTKKEEKIEEVAKEVEVDNNAEADIEKVTEVDEDKKED
jgi:RNA polymerase subunit RPABC4/transcription elongation factor Spt4